MTGGELLRKWREREGISQQRAAALLGLNQSSVSDYESGNQTPRIDQIVTIYSATAGAVPMEAWAKKRTKRRKAA